MKKPLIAIIGRPNVGKSALFNRICKKRLSIVHDEAGITRDRLYTTCEFEGGYFNLVDTAGITISANDNIQKTIEKQALFAMQEAQSLILVVDAQVGPTEEDLFLARKLLRANKPLCIAVNKIDDDVHNTLVHRFHSLGINHVIPISAIQNRGIYELLETALEGIALSPTEEEEQILKFCLMGRANVGKSTLLNALTKQNRAVVDSVAGTTRDSIDVFFQEGDKRYCCIDTAGIRRTHKEKEVVEKFAKMRTERAMERADMALFVLDATEPLTMQERRMLKLLEKLGKPILFLLNKWDLVKNFRMEHAIYALQRIHPYCAHMPILAISAETGRNLDKILPEAGALWERLNRNISTPELNRFIQVALAKNPSPNVLGKRLKIYYMTQVRRFPPSFVVFVNNPDLMSLTYRKYLTNQMREFFSLQGIAIKFFLKKRNNKKAAEKATVR